MCTGTNVKHADMQHDVSNHQEGCHAEITNKKTLTETQTMLEELRARAWTFCGPTPPNNAKKVAEERLNGILHEYYTDSDGNVWYKTETSRKYDEAIAKWQKERQKKKR